MSFSNIVKNYGHMHRLGKQIIRHKKNINHFPKSKLDREFLKQEGRIQRFIEETNKTNKAWNSNPETINEYWTGY